jgi:CsoR family transcriptional regulator, copper-sensing transcriptional repressor
MKSADARGGKRGAADVDDPARQVVQLRKAALLARLNRIEGQVRGVAAMIEADRYCVDVLTQISAIQSALDSAAVQLLGDHTRGCVQAAIRFGRDEHAIEELMQVVRRFAR